MMSSEVEAPVVLAQIVLVDVADGVLDRTGAAGDLLHRTDAGGDVRAIDTEAQPQALRLADRVAKADRGADRVRRVARHVDLFEIGRAIEHREAAADAVLGEIGIDVVEAVQVLVLARVEPDADLFAGTEEVVLLQVGAKDQPCVLGVTDAGTDAARGLLLDRVLHVDHVVSAGHLDVLGLHFLEEAQPLQPHPRLLDQRRRSRRRFHLAHLAAQHLVDALHVAAELDAPHVGALARIHEELQAPPSFSSSSISGMPLTLAKV
jgi:hypothetical protein